MTLQHVMSESIVAVSSLRGEQHPAPPGSDRRGAALVSPENWGPPHNSM